MVKTVNSTGAGTNQPLKVLLYVTGNINIATGNTNVLLTCKNRQGYDATGNCDLNNFMVYGYNSSTNANPFISVQGRAKFQAFIIAPHHTVGMQGGGSVGAIHGALWAKSWNSDPGIGSSSNSTPGVRQLGNTSTYTWADVASSFNPTARTSTTTVTTPKVDPQPAKVSRANGSSTNNNNNNN
jgi:hypothetical protein